MNTRILDARARRPLLGLAAGLLLLGGTAACGKKAAGKWAMPVDAKQLPPQTDEISAEVIDGTRETDPHIKQMYTSAELGSEICRPKSSDPAHDLETMSSLGSAGAKQFFKQSNLDAVQSLLECGELLTSNLDSPFQTAIDFNDDTSTRQEVGILALKAEDIPPKYGLTKHTFSGIDGFCRTSDPMKPNAPPTDCGTSSDAALHQKSTWFLGKRAALDTIAHGLVTPKSELSTAVSALNDAAAETEGLSSARIQAQLTTSKPFLSAPCNWGGYHTAGSMNDFVNGCFPNVDQKVIQGIDAKIRAAAFEIEPDVSKSGGVHGNIVLVGRDNDAAKEIEKDANDLVTDWKSQLQNNEAKLIAQAKLNAVSLRQKRWAIIVDNFLHALEKMKVTRSGRAVRLAFSEPLSDEDKRDLEEATKNTLDRRTAVADLLDGIQTKKPLPADALAKVVGAPWATYLIHAAPFDSGTKVAMTTPECKDAKKAASKLKAHDMPNREASTLLSQVESADCNHAPQFPAITHTCLTAGFATAVDFAKCAAPAEPPESEFGDHASAHATK